MEKKIPHWNSCLKIALKYILNCNFHANLIRSYNGELMKMIASKWILLLPIISFWLVQTANAATYDSAGVSPPANLTQRIQCTRYQVNSITTNQTTQTTSAAFDPGRCIPISFPWGGLVLIAGGNVGPDSLYNICFIPPFTYLHQSTEGWGIAVGTMGAGLSYTCCMAPANTMRASSDWENASGGDCT